MRRHFAFVMALFMALALIPGIALADKGGWDGGYGGGGWGPGGGNPGGGLGGGGNPGGQQGSYLNQENWDGSIKVVYDTFEVSNGRNASKNGAGVTAVTLNGTAVTWQDSNKTGAASGAEQLLFFRKQPNGAERGSCHNGCGRLLCIQNSCGLHRPARPEPVQLPNMERGQCI